MTWLDYAVLGVVGVSVAWGIWRGLVREVISLAGWIIAFLAASLFAGPLGEVLPATIPTPELRTVAAFLGVFVGTLVVTTLTGALLSRLVRAIGLGGLDSVLGMLFGVARAALIVLAFALLAGLTTLPYQRAWKQSLVGAPLAEIALALKPWLPPAFAARLRYH
jgi:membrane protein required for colicin V production